MTAERYNLELLKEEKLVLEHYLQVLELRAHNENIDLTLKVKY